MKRGLGQIEARLLAYAQMRGVQIIRAGELTGPLQINETQERKVLSGLARAGVIARVWRGLYLVPSRLPLGGKWSPSEALALNTLMENQGARYQICGPNAFNRYGFDDQIPTRTYAYNNRIYGDRTIGQVALTLIRVADDRLGDTETVTMTDGQPIIYASRVRSLVDAVYDWSRFNSLPRGYVWIRQELATGRVEAARLLECALRYGDVGTIRRIGFLLEREGVAENLLRKLERKLKPTTGPIPWIPTRPKIGSVNRRWGVVDNEQD